MAEPCSTLEMEVRARGNLNAQLMGGLQGLIWFVRTQGSPAEVALCANTNPLIDAVEVQQRLAEVRDQISTEINAWISAIEQERQERLRMPRRAWDHRPD